MTVPNKDLYNYLDELNPQQKEAVLYKDGPALVIAGAGSGKTRVLLYKIVDLIRNGYEPYRILALTFTNKAAKVMRERIKDILGEKISDKIRMGTFHSIFLRILRMHADKIGYKDGFTIYDSADSNNLIRMIIKDMQLEDINYKVSSLAYIISNLKNELKSPDDFYNEDNDIKTKKDQINKDNIYKIYQAYCERCRIANAMDFDDILVYTYRLLDRNPDIKRHYQEFFKYILIDEYQDTNLAQHQIISLLVGDGKHLFIVGDDAQSIYSFRGANIDNIILLEKRYPDLKIFKLERNYRSTQNITKAASSLIEKNTKQIKKNIFSENEPGERIEIIKTYSDLEEASLISNLISNSKLSNHDSYNDYAVLYRTNAQSRVLEESLRKRAIPYRIYGGVSFYNRKEVKDLVAYFRLSVNPDDDEALKRVINYPLRGIGETTMKKISSLALEMGLSLWQTITTINLKEKGFNSGTVSKLKKFTDLINEFIEDNKKGSDAYQLGQLIFNRTGIISLLSHEDTSESISRKENLYEIMTGLKDFVDLANQTAEDDYNSNDMKSYLSQIMLLTDQDTDKEDEDNPRVTLMTVHAAKGLEFKHVYVVGVEEDLFPSAMSQDSLYSVEEERRLLYVAITRAINTCVITYATSRYRNGNPVMPNPSRFLRDFDYNYIKIEDSNIKESPFPFNLQNYKSSSQGRSNFYINKTKKKIPYSSSGSNFNISNLKKIGEKLTESGVLTPHNVEDFSVGTLIKHERYGKGKVIKIDQLQGNDTITVDFGVVGIKKLLIKFAKFSIIKNEY